MKTKETLKLVCINCVFAVFMFASAYMLSHLQILFVAEINQVTVGQTTIYTTYGKMFLDRTITTILMSFPQVFSLFFVFVINKSVDFPNMKKVIILNSFAFCLFIMTCNFIFRILHAIHVYVYYAMYSYPVSAMITQVLLAVLFIRSNKDEKSATG